MKINTKENKIGKIAKFACSGGDDGNGHPKIYLTIGENELTVLELEPNNPITVTTQFDVQYDDEMKYTVGIIPNRYGLQDTQEMAFICVKNC